jgi:CsoR family transcriptional regulator, copper-sensing transcriptional repressor
MARESKDKAAKVANAAANAGCDACAAPGQDTHPDHRDQLKRLARIRGQIDGIVRMIEDDRYCIDILTQTSAARAALKSLEAAILEKHMAHCVREAMAAGDNAQVKIEELMTVFKKAS